VLHTPPIPFEADAIVSPIFLHMNCRSRSSG
jgi:hypothetical protein